MMVNAIIQLLAIVLRPIQGLTSDQSELVASVVVLGTLKGYSMQNLNQLIKQSYLESNDCKDWKVDAFKNPWGMSRVDVRPTNQVGSYDLTDGNTFGIYRSITDATRDRFAWDVYWGYDENRQKPDYLRSIAKRYIPSTQYEGYVSAVADRPAPGSGTGVACLVALAPTTFFLIKTLLR